MRKYFASKIFEWFWPEIRLFTRWCMHSGHCRQSCREKDYQRFVSERDWWIKKEKDKEDYMKAIYSE